MSGRVAALVSRSTKLSHGAFVILFCVLLYVSCNLLNIDKLARWFTSSDGMDYLALSAYLIAGQCLFIAVFALMAHRWVIKPLSILLTLASASATYFISKYGVAIDRSMLMNVIHTDRTEIGQLLSPQMVPYVVFLIVIPVAVVCSVDIGFKSSGKYLVTSLKIVLTTLVAAVALLLLNFNAIHRAGNVSNKYVVYSLVPINIISSSVSALSKAVKPYLLLEDKDVEFAGRVSLQDNLVVVLAIGESSRRSNFSLYGYGRRNTNPILEKVQGLHLLNGVAKRGSTLYALPEILERQGVKLTAATSKLEIPTACYVNYTLYDNCDSVGEIAVGDCSHGGRCYDEDVIPLLENNLKSYVSGYRLLVLHLGGGSHGPSYADRHPPEFKQFVPFCDDADVAGKCSVEQLYNSYDNTILYVDHVLGEIVRSLDRSNAPYVFIYLSDHGESLMEEGRLFHGMPPGISLPPEQAQIPLIVKASIPISVVNRPEISQPDVFDTVLDLLSIESAAFDKRGSFIKKQTDTVMSDITNVASR